ncbi:hypothetical protein [Acidovorax sp.]|uniref:hypothetical protein n=1 Tax=Acidovorax sp. TaxID=1872122 RepID=UPI00391FB25C
MHFKAIKTTRNINLHFYSKSEYNQGLQVIALETSHRRNTCAAWRRTTRTWPFATLVARAGL